MKRRALAAVAAVVAALAFVTMVHAEVVIETVTVGNPGNANDTHGAGYGGVDYFYNIGLRSQSVMPHQEEEEVGTQMT